MFVLKRNKTLGVAVAAVLAMLLGLVARPGDARDVDAAVSAGAALDVLSPDLPAEQLRALLASEESSRTFEPVGDAVMLRTAEGPTGFRATMALPADRRSIPASAWETGVVIARITSEGPFPSLGLSPGVNYVWIDRLGPAEDPWRGIVLSADGARRVELENFKYTPASDHTNPGGPLGHAEKYCDGADGCLYQTPRGTAQWERCARGCCEIQIGL